MWKADNWKEYTLLDASNGNRLERWGDYTLVRPDPQVIWQGVKQHSDWKIADASYSRSRSGGGAWNQNKLPESWQIEYENLGLRFGIKLMGFKHTGVFPEQAVNWEWFSKLIKEAVKTDKVEIRKVNDNTYQIKVPAAAFVVLEY